MKELLKLQTQFQHYLLAAQDSVLANVVATEQVPAEVRLNIYKHAYQCRLLDALASTYTALQTYIGVDEFAELGNEYIATYPSTYRSIRWYGDKMHTFLSNHRNYKEFPYLAEIARVEWIMTLVFDAAPSQILTLEAMGNIPAEAWELMHFVAHPSTHLIHLAWNVVPIWQAISNDEPVPEATKAEVPLGWIFWRKDLINQFCSLAEDERYAFDTLLTGATFGEICVGLCQWHDEQHAAIRAGSLLKGWITAGLIAEVIIDE